MILFIVVSGIITALAIVLCVFSGAQQRKEDQYLARRQPGSREERERIDRERADWDLLNHWDDERG